MRLETVNTRSHVVHIISPSRHSRVPFDLRTRDPTCGHGILKGLPGLGISDLLFLPNPDSFTNELVLADTRRVSTVSTWFQRPITFATLALVSLEVDRIEELDGVELLVPFFKHWLELGLDFFRSHALNHFRFLEFIV
jgi:hypothetical protein